MEAFDLLHTVIIKSSGFPILHGIYTIFQFSHGKSFVKVGVLGRH